GDADSGGSTTTTVPTGGTLTGGVTQIFSTGYAFAALKADGSVVTWGDAAYGGSTTTTVPTGGTLTGGVTQIFSARLAFAALKADGSVVTWGDAGTGGSTTSPVNAAASLTSGVETIASPLFRPAYLPGAPTQVAVAQPAVGETTVVVSFLAPGANGGTPITGYRATCSSSTGAGEAEATTSSTDSLRISVEGLTLGATYACAVRARNIVGEGQPSAASNSFITSAPAAPAVAQELSPLRSSVTCRRTTCTTRGPVPPGATAVTQRATTSAAPTAQSREMARPKVKTAKGTCRITKRGKGKTATRTYQCTIRLSKGKWTITTKALKKTTVIAQSVKTKKVK
ncbi:MAG: fibronectin type III domain-containing protein, partial [Actinobacteria bacterium]|nr:fibronectin type III domain-containing protein [Actinomycetota bacterium]